MKCNWRNSSGQYCGYQDELERRQATILKRNVASPCMVVSGLVSGHLMPKAVDMTIIAKPTKEV